MKCRSRLFRRLSGSLRTCVRSCVNSARPVSRCENPAGPYFEPLPDWQYKAGIAPRGIVIAPGDTIIPQIANRGTPQDGGFYKDATRCAVNRIYRSAAVTLLAVATAIGAAHGQTESLDIRTGVYRGQRVTYQVINGLAVVEGDIILGTPEELEPPSGPQVIKEPDARQKAVATSDPETLWPEGVVPYTIDGGLPEPQRVLDAIEHWHDNTLIRLVERTNETDWINFVEPDESTCASRVGMTGGEQDIVLADFCSVGSVIHEIGHAVGLWHEQQREDRDSHVNVLFDNIDKRWSYAFTQRIRTGDDIGPYDFGSIMHYSAFAFSRNNQPVIGTIPPGLVIGQRRPVRRRHRWSESPVRPNSGHDNDFHEPRRTRGRGGRNDDHHSAEFQLVIRNTSRNQRPLVSRKQYRTIPVRKMERRWRSGTRHSGIFDDNGLHGSFHPAVQGGIWCDSSGRRRCDLQPSFL